MTRLTHKSNHKFIRGTTAVAGVLLCVAASSPALAGDGYSLTFSPEKIASPEAMEQLHEKVRAIASEVCPTYRETRSFKLLATCRNDVQSELIAKINLPAFTVFAEQAGQSPSRDFVADIGPR